MQKMNGFYALLAAAGLTGALCGTPVLAASSPAPAASTAVGAATSDTDITAQVKDKLASAGYRDVAVTVNGGAVTLVGSAQDAQVKANVEAVAKSVDGVTSVDNRLKTPAERPQIPPPPAA
ncbi:MAG TPA: BON domain-containing protein [Gammaproteobacteria bacterium]|jgi:poly(3-hydroxybutyrate) depolymerase|nr:BON domain-containing protein [Gammaproteobacteria bacterium]